MRVTFRMAQRVDVAEVVALLSDDALGKGRETGDITRYELAFDAMSNEASNMLIVGALDGRIVATYQLTIISGISLNAARRAQIEGVRVASDLRGQGIGERLLQDAEERARRAGATLMQFTTNATRKRAYAFYKRSGYVDSHIGFKKKL